MTSDKVFFSEVDCSDVLDHIPLHEIKDVLDPAAFKPDTARGKGGFSRAKSSIKTSSPTNAKGMDPLMFSDNDDDTSVCNIVVIHTIENGHNSGRTTILLAETENERDEWAKFLSTSKDEALDRKNRPEDLGFISNLQRTCRQIYFSNLTQYGIGFVIMCSYMTGIHPAILY